MNGTRRHLPRKNASSRAISPTSVANLSHIRPTEQKSRGIVEYGSRPTTSVVVEPRAAIQKAEWLESASKSTEYFKRYGSPVPLVWVLIEDNNIPESAVPFGEDREGYTMYIARALLEGDLHIGRASPQLNGAIIGFAGKEHLIHHYEVLVCATQLHWGFPPVDSRGVLAQGTVVLAQQSASNSRIQKLESGTLNTTLVDCDIPRFVPESINVPPYKEADLKTFAEIKTVVIIDDSMSMQQDDLWEQAREALGGIVEIANQYGSKGADVHFMHHIRSARNVQYRSAVNTLFNQVQPEGDNTPTGAKLGQIVDQYLPLIEDERRRHEPIKVVVITDGLPTDQEKLESAIVDAAHRLDRNRVKHDMFGIQFVQIGTDPAASDLLRELDAHLMARYDIRNIVDSSPFDPAQGAFNTDYMMKILLGSLHKYSLDRDAGPKSGSITLPSFSPLRPRSRN